MAKIAKIAVPLAAIGAIAATGGAAAPAVAAGTTAASTGLASAAAAAAGIPGSLAAAAGASSAVSIPTILQTGGTLLAAGGAIQQGVASSTAAKFQAKQLEQRADRERAVGQRRFEETKRQGRLAQSRALAVAASSGAGAFNPGVVNAIGDIEAEAALRASLALNAGEESAIGMEMGSAAERLRARNAKTRAVFGAGTTLLTNGSSLYERYS